MTETTAAKESGADASENVDPQSSEPTAEETAAAQIEELKFQVARQSLVLEPDLEPARRASQTTSQVLIRRNSTLADAANPGKFLIDPSDIVGSVEDYNAIAADKVGVISPKKPTPQPPAKGPAASGSDTKAEMIAAFDALTTGAGSLDADTLKVILSKSGDKLDKAELKFAMAKAVSGIVPAVLLASTLGA
eukprot:gene7777-19440_t